MQVRTWTARLSVPRQRHVPLLRYRNPSLGVPRQLYTGVHALRKSTRAYTRNDVGSKAGQPSDSDPDVGFSEGCPIDCDPDGYSSGLVRGSRLKYNDPQSLPLRRRGFLQWEPGRPSNVLIVKKPRNEAATEKLRDIATWLQKRGINVYVERPVHATEFSDLKCFQKSSRTDIDLCITLGGDGTVLFLASLFDEDEPLPPVMSFAMGSLGFLTPFDASHFESHLSRVLEADNNPLFCTLRTRMQCEVRAHGRIQAVHTVLNEVVVDRGAVPNSALLEIFIDGNYVTTVDADGLIIATPSGSTAYSMSAGGSLIAPSVPCTIITPIAPLSLSFRPIVIPESSTITVHLPHYARSHARASFDGKNALRLRKDSSITVSTSRNPLPMINLGNLDSDWYEGITSKLKWNLSLRPVPHLPPPRSVASMEQASMEQASMDGDNRPYSQLRPTPREP